MGGRVGEWAGAAFRISRKRYFASVSFATSQVHICNRRADTEQRHVSRESEMPSTMQELERRRAEARAGGGAKRVAAQPAKGKLTARERLDVLLDEGSFEELRSEERRVGKECGSTGRSRWSPCH